MFTLEPYFVNINLNIITTLTLVWRSVVVWQQSDLDLFVLVKQLFLRLHLRFGRHG